MLLGHDELDLVLRADRHLQAAEVYPVQGREGLRRVPWAVLSRPDPGGPLVVPGRLLASLVIEFVASQFLVSVLRPLLARLR